MNTRAPTVLAMLANQLPPAVRDSIAGRPDFKVNRFEPGFDSVSCMVESPSGSESVVNLDASAFRARMVEAAFEFFLSEPGAHVQRGPFRGGGVLWTNSACDNDSLDGWAREPLVALVDLCRSIERRRTRYSARTATGSVAELIEE